MTAPVRVLMVCLGNICRSPTAEAVLRAQLQRLQLDQLVEVDSAGTSDWHVGEAPDPRSIRHAATRNYDLAPLRARQVRPADFEAFHYILAMDTSNLADLQRRCSPQYQDKLGLFLQHGAGALQEVPDPFEHGPEGFEQVLDLVEEACAGLVVFLQGRHALPHLEGKAG